MPKKAPPRCPCVPCVNAREAARLAALTHGSETWRGRKDLKVIRSIGAGGECSSLPPVSIMRKTLQFVWTRSELREALCLRPD